LEITYLGLSAFRFRGKDVAVVTDPYSPDLGITMGKVQAKIVTVSHKSPNHGYTQGVEGDPRVISGPGEYEVADILIAGVATASAPKQPTLNTAYVFRFDDLTVCHLGDLRAKLTDKQVEEIGSIDVLCIPVGGGKALDAGAAASVMAQLDASVVIPMHYQIDGMKVDGLDTVEPFCREIGLKEYVPEQKLTMTRNSLPSEVKVVVLENRRI
jgi:L-ascorbate metabolism protein UlaG (beta-lactamase superfamily)